MKIFLHSIFKIGLAFVLTFILAVPVSQMHIRYAQAENTVEICSEPSEADETPEMNEPEAGTGEEPLAASTQTPEPQLLYGDADDDLKVAAADALLVLRFVVNLRTPTERQKIAADVDSNGEVTAVDALLILRYVVGLTEKLPIESSIDTEMLSDCSVTAVSDGTADGSFRVTLSGVVPQEAVDFAQAAVWSVKDGQDDLVQTAMKKSGDIWYADIDTSLHQYDEGEYLVQIYVTDLSQNRYLAAECSYEVTIDRSQRAMSADWIASDGTLQVNLTNTYTGRNTVSVRFAVWSETDGQDDLIWYDGVKYADGCWRCTVPLADHKGTGAYDIHAYAYQSNGSKEFLKGAEASVLKTSAAVSAQTFDKMTGSFRVYIKAPTIPETVKQIKVGVWSSKNGQDDLIWTTAVQYEDYWYADIQTAAHMYDEGSYSIHAYVTDKGNQTYYCGGTSHTVSVDRSARKLSASVDSANAKMTLKLENIYTGRNVTSVKFAVWSSKNGQDDLIWHNAARNSDGSWQASIDLGTHGYDDGLYYIHAYQYTDSDKQCLAATSVPVSIDLPYVRLRARSVLNQAGWNLRAAFNWSAGLTYYRPTPKPSSGESHTQFYGEYGFRNYKGNCYVMAATFYWMAKELGYEVYLVEGYVPRRGGGVTVHGWTEIIIDGTLYVCDPNFTNETGRNGYLITYGASGTWMYQSYARVN